MSSVEVSIPASAVISALSYALDLTEGQPMGHAVQTCLLGMRIAACLDLPPETVSNLYYALLLKDAGCSSNASKLFQLFRSDEIRTKRDLKDKDWTKPGLERLRFTLDHVATGKPFLERVRAMIQLAANKEISSCDLVQLRCERGASIARRIGFSEEVAMAIASLDEHWDGCGYPCGLAGEAIPILARIMNLAQTLAVFWTLGGVASVEAMLDRRAGRWFDPQLVSIVRSLAAQQQLWTGMDDDCIVDLVRQLEPVSRILAFDADHIDNLCFAFSEVIDSKSPFTFRHSQGVALAAVTIGRRLGLPADELRMLNRASLLHDIGKLSVPNTILEKPGKLDQAEWNAVKKHPYYTLEILRRVPGFETLAEIAASHHERLDGTGYFRGQDATNLDLHARILSVADVYDALRAERPYRAALPLEEVFSIMFRDAPHALDIDCLAALEASPVDLPELPVPFPSSVQEAKQSLLNPVPKYVF